VYGIEASSTGRLSFEDFLKVMKKMDIKISNTNVNKRNGFYNKKPLGKETI